MYPYVTSHGFNRIYGSASLPIKIMWTIFLMSVVGGFGYHLIQLIHNYMGTPVSTNLIPRAVQFQPPDISLCNVNPFSYTASYETFTKTPHKTYELINVAQAIGTKAALNSLPTDMISVMLMVRDGSDLYHVQQYVGTRKEFFIVDCKYKGYNCSFEDFQNFWGDTYGACFRFAPSDTLLNLTKDIDEFSMDLVLFTDTKPVDYQPFLLTVFDSNLAGFTYDGTYDLSKSGGAILYYGEKDHYPRRFINLSPGVYSRVNFDMVEYRYVNRDSKPCAVDDTNVYFDDFQRKRIKFIKSKEDCQYNNLVKQILNNCGCLSAGIIYPYYDTEETYNQSKCHSISETSLNATQFKFRTQCERDHFLLQSTLFNQMADCQKNCKERIYTPYVSMSSWPVSSLATACKDALMQEHISRMRNTNLTVPDTFLYFLNNLSTPAEVQQKFATNFAKISLGASKSFSMLVEEIESYTIFDLFSDIGGIIGLYLGMSILTMCEIFELVFVLNAELRNAYNGHKERMEMREKSRRSREQMATAIRDK